MSSVGIRPEKLFVKSDPTPSNGGILLPVTMEEVTFLGQLLRFHVTFEGKMMIVDDFGGINRALRYQKLETAYIEDQPQGLSSHTRTR